jgi:hypothetical protein
LPIPELAMMVIESRDKQRIWADNSEQNRIVSRIFMKLLSISSYKIIDYELMRSTWTFCVQEVWAKAKTLSFVGRIEESKHIELSLWQTVSVCNNSDSREWRTHEFNNIYKFTDMEQILSDGPDKSCNGVVRVK